MTDKKIINDVDVSERRYYDSNADKATSYLHDCTKDDTPFFSCKSMPYCLYKQLQREKQNSKDTYEMFQALMDSFNILQKELGEEKQKVKELEEKADKRIQEYIKSKQASYEEMQRHVNKTELRNYKLCKQVKELEERLKNSHNHCKNELKKYKKGIHKYRIMLKDKISHLELSRREFSKEVGRFPKFEREKIKNALDKFNESIDLINNDNKYKQVLEEIKEISETCLNAEACFACKYCDNCEIKGEEPLTYNACQLILQKCKVLKDEK